MKINSTLFKFLLLFIAFYCTPFLMAQNNDIDSHERIAAISINGLKRTRLSTAERPLQKFIGLEASQVNFDEVWAEVLALGVLEPISVEIDGQTLVVTVREKWAIFPIPLAMGNSSGFSFGLAVLDNNAFGLNDTLAFGGVYHPESWMAAIAYLHNSPGGRIPGWNGRANFSRGERIDRDQNNQELRRYELDEISLRAALSFPLVENSDFLTASAQFYFDDKSLRNTDKALNGPEAGVRLFGIGSEFAIKNNSWDGYLLSRETAALRYSLRTTPDGGAFHSIRFKGTWEKPFIPGFRVNLRSGIVFEPNLPILYEASPSDSQTDILPRGFSANNYAGLSAGLEKYIYKFPIATLSVSAAYQIVYSHGSILGNSFDHGVAGFLNVYLSRLAIPALGLGAAYNIKENYFQASFILGIDF